MHKKGIFSRKRKTIQLLSWEQLKDDFGEFPPSPLTATQKPRRIFTINYISRIGKSILDVKITIQLLRHFLRHPEDDYTLLIGKNVDLSFGLEPLKQQHEEFLASWRKLGVIRKFLVLLVLLVLFPILIVFVLYLVARSLYLVTGIVLRLIKSGSEFNSVGGFFSDVPGNRESIYVNSKRDEGSPLQFTHIITHEHIHLLQSAFRDISGDYGQPAKYIRDPRLVLCDKYCDEFKIYLLEKGEVEARLHEVVLSIYRQCHGLPLTLPAFYSALLSNNQISLALKDESFVFPKEDHSERFGESYDTRSIYIGEDLFRLIASMKCVDTRTKFVLEVLALMYANLLRYYGDEEASINFGNQVQRPNLYDRLYLSGS